VKHYGIYIFGINDKFIAAMLHPLQNQYFQNINTTLHVTAHRNRVAVLQMVGVKTIKFKQGVSVARG
jgi:translation initiation factor 6 (eIF-6)